MERENRDCTQRRDLLRGLEPRGGLGAGRRAAGTYRAERYRQPVFAHGDCPAITSKQDKTNLPTHIPVKAGTGGLSRDSVVLLEQIRTLDKHRLRERAGRVGEEEMRRVDAALGVSFGLQSGV